MVSLMEVEPGKEQAWLSSASDKPAGFPHTMEAWGGGHIRIEDAMVLVEF